MTVAELVATLQKFPQDYEVRHQPEGSDRPKRVWRVRKEHDDEPNRAEPPTNYVMLD